jgi:hypothetical protein
MAKSVFFSFHYGVDAWRVQQVTNMGAVEGQPILNSQQWEEVKRSGDRAIEDWIDREMKYKSAVVVLVGAETADRPWVRYEIAKAWNEKRPLVGVRIHGLADGLGRSSRSGADPFAKVGLSGGGSVADYVSLVDPAGQTSNAVYNTIRSNIASWAEGAYKRP